MLLLLLVGSVVVLVGIAAKRAKRLAPITQGMNVASSLLVVVALVPIVAFAGEAIRSPSGIASAVLPPVTSISPIDAMDGSPQRDIYYIVLDRYGSQRALEALHGLDNAEFIDWLRKQGFQVVDDARANYVRSLPSIAAVLSMSLLDPVIDELGPRSSDYAPILDFVSSSRVAAALQEQGYEYIHIGSWFPGTRHSQIADQGFASDTPTTFPSAVLSYSAAGLVAEGLGFTRTPDEIHAAAAEYQLEVLRSLRDQPGPKFVFAHVLLPHAPYVYKADGTFDPTTADYGYQLDYTNREIRKLVQPLLGLPEDERPIIILQADEGPYPERYVADPGFDWAAATGDEVVTKFGILSAMFLPGSEGAAPLPSGLSSVNTFREILSRYFDADLPNLPDRSYASLESHPYALTEVTDRFPGPD